MGPLGNSVLLYPPETGKLQVQNLLAACSSTPLLLQVTLLPRTIICGAQMQSENASSLVQKAGESLFLSSISSHWLSNIMLPSVQGYRPGKCSPLWTPPLPHISVHVCMPDFSTPPPHTQTQLLCPRVRWMGAGEKKTEKLSWGLGEHA